eukprot:6207651-Pleurochrysis_carterae.AAC.11
MPPGRLVGRKGDPRARRQDENEHISDRMRICNRRPVDPRDLVPKVYISPKIGAMTLKNISSLVILSRALDTTAPQNLLINKSGHVKWR